MQFARAFDAAAQWVSVDVTEAIRCLSTQTVDLRQQNKIPNTLFWKEQSQRRKTLPGVTGRLFSMLLCSIVSKLCWLDLLCRQCYAVTFFVMQSGTIKSDIFLSLSALPLWFVLFFLIIWPVQFWASTHTKKNLLMPLIDCDGICACKDKQSSEGCCHFSSHWLWWKFSQMPQCISGRRQARQSWLIRLECL